MVRTGRPQTENDLFDVIIVGGGFAGVSALIKLQEKGRKVLLLEADKTLGGRARSKATKHGDGASFDLGAHFIGNTHKRVMKLIKMLGCEDTLIDYVKDHGEDPISINRLDSHTCSAKLSDCYFEIQGLDSSRSWNECFQLLAICVHLEFLCASIDGKRPWKSINAKYLDSITFGEYVNKDLHLEPWIKDLALSGVRGVWGQDPFKMSALYVMWYMKNNGGFSEIFSDNKDAPQQYGLRIGLAGLMQKWADAKIDKSTSTVMLNSAVERVEIHKGKSGNGNTSRAKVVLASGQSFAGMKVIVATTPTVCQHIEFQPKVSPERQLIFEQKSGSAVKATVVYNTPWWQHHSIASVLNGQNYPGLDWFLNITCLKDKSYRLCVFVKPEWYDQHKHEEDSDKFKLSLGKIIMDGVLGDKRALDIQEYTIFDWRTHPHTKGGPNTNFGVNVLTQAAQTLHEPEHGCVYFCGAEHATAYTGYVEGAIASGEYVAEQILTEGKAKLPGKGIQWVYFFICRIVFAVLTFLARLCAIFSCCCSKKDEEEG